MMLRHASATGVDWVGQEEIGKRWVSVNVIGKRKNANDTFLRLEFAENSGLFVRRQVAWVPRMFDVVHMGNFQPNGMIGGLRGLSPLSPSTPIASMSPKMTTLWHLGRAQHIVCSRVRRLCRHMTDMRSGFLLGEHAVVSSQYVCREDEGQE